MKSKDAYMTLALYEYQYKEFNKQGMENMKNVFETIEMPLLNIIEDMQRSGVNINQGMLDQLYEKYSVKLEEAKKKVYKEIEPYENDIKEYKIKHYNHKLDDPINLGSPLQLNVLFYDILHYKVKDKKGTGVDVLQALNTPLTNALLEYRGLEKIIDAFIIALPKQVEPFDGRIHTDLHQYRGRNTED